MHNTYCIHVKLSSSLSVTNSLIAFIICIPPITSLVDFLNSSSDISLFFCKKFEVSSTSSFVQWCCQIILSFTKIINWIFFDHCVSTKEYTRFQSWNNLLNFVDFFYSSTVPYLCQIKFMFFLSLRERS
jgi:hypothetical protein